jgi:hypothetical protein
MTYSFLNPEGTPIRKSPFGNQAYTGSTGAAGAPAAGISDETYAHLVNQLGMGGASGGAPGGAPGGQLSMPGQIGGGGNDAATAAIMNSLRRPGMPGQMPGGGGGGGLLAGLLEMLRRKQQQQPGGGMPMSKANFIGGQMVPGMAPSAPPAPPMGGPMGMGGPGPMAPAAGGMDPQMAELMKQMR